MHSDGSRLLLKLVAENESVHFVAAALGDESVYEEIFSHALSGKAVVEAQIAAFCDGRLPGDQLHWAITNRQTNECLGSLQANLKANKTVEIGYRVHSKHQNFGFATEALRQLVAQLVDAMPTHRLVAYPQNLASQKVLLKANFVAVDTPSETIEGTAISRRCFQYSVESCRAA